MNEQFLRKAAVFLMALGPDAGGKVMSKLPQNIVEELTHVIATTGHIKYAERKAVLSDFITISSQISCSVLPSQDSALAIS